MEKMLITKVVRTDATRAELYQKGHKWPDLKLFDLSELGAVGIDYEALPVGQEIPCRFWAQWELSDRVNQAGNPYKDVVALEAIDAPATATSTDTSALLAELRAIREVVTAIAKAQGLISDLETAFPRYGDGSAVSEIPAERESFLAYQKVEGQPPASVEALRAWFRQNQNGT